MCSTICLTQEICTHLYLEGLRWLCCLIQAEGHQLQKKRSSNHGGQVFLAIGFDLAPLLGTNMVYFRGMDFSEGPAAAFLKTLLWGTHQAQNSCSLPTESLAKCYLPHTTTCAWLFCLFICLRMFPPCLFLQILACVL